MPESSMLTDGRSGDLELEMDECQGNVPIKPGQSDATIDILPDDALLAIFLLYKDSSDLSWWQPLVHVCRRWRHVIFASPLHLKLVLVCTIRTPARESLGIWPPIRIALHFTPNERRGHNENIIAAMERPDRITDIRLENLMSHSFEQLTRMMETPFPALTYLSLKGDGIVPHPLKDRNDSFLLRDVFLGGSAPSLRTFVLRNIQFPALPKLLLSATQLVTLRLSWVPTPSRTSLREMVTCLAALSNLKHLDINHFYMFPGPDGSPLPTHVVLLSLTSFYFQGISDHLEDLVAQIDAPMLQNLSLTLGGIIRIPQLLRFISRTEKLKLPIRAVFVFERRGLLLKFLPSDRFEFSSTFNWFSDQFIAMALLCSSLSPLLSHVERLDFYCGPLSTSAREFVNPGRWLDIFRPFIAVQSLCVPNKVWLQVGPALRALAEESATEVFPGLRTLFLEEPFEEAKKSIESLISARRLTVQPYSPVP